MVSRAYHDSLFMSRIAPTAMLFIPCRNGNSHRPDEYASPEDIAQGNVGPRRDSGGALPLTVIAEGKPARSRIYGLWHNRA